MIETAVNNAVTAGATVVAAPGNCGNPGNLSKCSGLNAPAFPAALANTAPWGTE